MPFFNGVKKACRCIMQGSSEPKETVNESSKRYKNIRWKRISVSSRSPSSSSADVIRQRREDALRERGLLPSLPPTNSARGQVSQWDVRTLVGGADAGAQCQDKIRQEDEPRPVPWDVLEWLAEVDVPRGYNGGEIDFVEMNSNRSEGADIPGDVSPLLDGTPDYGHSMHPGECRFNDSEYVTLSSPSQSEHSSLTCAADLSSEKWATEGLRIDFSSMPPSRPVLDITIHSHGSIMMETSHIEDDESRRLTELAYLL